MPNDTLDLNDLDLSNLTDDQVAPGVRFDDPQSQFSPDGMLSTVTGQQKVTDVTTQQLNIQNYRMGKFLRSFSKTSFDDLQEVPQSNGDTLWVMEAAIDNQDFNFYMSKGDMLASVELTEVTSEQQIKEMAAKYKIKPEQTYLTIDGKKYFTRMDVPLHFGTGQNNDAWINLGIFVLGDGVMALAIARVVAAFGIDAFKDAFKNLSSAVFKTLWAVVRGVSTAAFRFMTNFVRTLVSGGALDEAVAAARSAAGDAWAESVQNVTSKTLKYTVVGVIIIVTLLLIVEFVLHESYQNVYFYNLTSYDIVLDFPYKSHGDYHNLVTDTVQAKTKRVGPGGSDLGTWYNGVAFRYQSDSEFTGLGYALRFKMLDPKTGTLVKTFSCLFDVPFDGKNSLFASTSAPASYSDYYSSNAGKKQTPQFSTSDGSQEIIVTFDYLTGKHEDPETGNSLFLYSSLVIIRDVGT